MRQLCFVSIAVACLTVFACSEEPTPNQLPSIVDASAAALCEDSGDPEVGLVLAGGEVTVLDDNLVGASVDVGGLETITLTPDSVAEPDPEVPLRWSFSFDTARRVRCSGDLVLTFTVWDEEGETASVSTAAQ